MIGTFACGVCDSLWYLLYIILFAVLGILLFAYLAVFNVTITDGFLNGFIFYSNIINVYLTFYIPSLPNSARILPEVIISFLNLDFGIPICFYPDMTELHLAFLRFVFPIYLMVILLVVTLCGRCISNQIVSKFFQKMKVTQVFATLILISYTSFIQTSFAVLSYATIQGAVNPRRWRVDPNILYNDPLHVVLVVISVAFLLIFVPIPLFLLYPRLIYRTPVLRKLKPLVDAFIAPFAPKREFWIGLRMIFRLVFYLLSILLTDASVLVVLSVCLAILTVVEVNLQPFNSRAKNFVSRALMMNMTIFSITAISAYLLPEERSSNFNVFNLYIFLILFIVVNLHYCLIRFKCTRDHYEKVINYLKKKWKQLILKISSSNAKKKRMKKTDSTTLDLTTHTSLDFPEPCGDNFEETEFIAFREVILVSQSSSGGAKGAIPDGEAQ